MKNSWETLGKCFKMEDIRTKTQHFIDTSNAQFDHMIYTKIRSWSPFNYIMYIYICDAAESLLRTQLARETYSSPQASLQKQVASSRPCDSETNTKSDLMKCLDFFAKKNETQIWCSSLIFASIGNSNNFQWLFFKKRVLLFVLLQHLSSYF